MTRKKTVLSGLIVLTTLYSFAQDIEIQNLRATREGQIAFDYTIAKGHSDRERYDVQIFTSADNYAKPLAIQISDIPPEQNQKVSFRGADHFPQGYSGSVRIRLVAEATLYPVQITNYSKKIKMGATMNISWQDAGNNSNYDVVLKQAGKSNTLANGVSGTSYSGTLPADLGKGSYQLLIIPSGDQQSTSDQMSVSITGKMGLGIKVLGALALGGVGILASAGGGGGEGTGSASLPGPPDTPDN